MRTTFPTLADVARENWPAKLRIVPADPTIGGDVDRVMCGCYRAVPPNEIVDLRELSALARASLGVDRPILCHACFHHENANGTLLHADIASALGMQGAVVASLQSASTEALARGWHAETPLNAQLAPPALAAPAPAPVKP